MHLRLWAVVLVFVPGMNIGAGPSPKNIANSAAKRGQRAVRGQPALNPPLWSVSAYDAAWKQWGLKDRPVDYPRALRERFGLFPAPYDNQGLPMGLHAANGLLGKGVVNDCLLCHAGTVAGQTIVGLGNASLDLQGLFDEFSAAEGLGWKFPFQFSHVRGTIDPIGTVVFLMELRDPDLNLQKQVKLDYPVGVCSDPPAWWLLKKKKTRNWAGNVDARSVRIDMVNLASPFNGPDHIKKQEPVFADIHAFIMTVEAPKYPFPIDKDLAARGRDIFNQTCARCHGTYGPDAKYPNKIVDLDDLGTDPTLALAITKKNLDYINKSWFAQEKGPDGKLFQIAERHGYQAPPLDGIWATAPYFHNGSAPTVYHVLNSKARPKIYTRSYRTGIEEYDAAKLGWKITVLDQPASLKLSPLERRKIYDTTLPGRSNAGHIFGDDLNEGERRAVIEYLKGL